ncbi:hypothetical protein CSUB01_10472 [Colletotrichum sublineola]|uniref:BZIP domain-containing protein n=1 Tax=Colletotrichum sublineola TaxID=1173701 RepID=A0A066XXT5_COLSU|nr:hypothetical protein CSUB01_10472 [Colletotrichum sublineola]
MSPASDHTTFSDITSASTHTSPKGIIPEPSSSALRHYRYHELQEQRSSEMPQLTGTKRRHSETHIHSSVVRFNGKLHNTVYTVRYKGLQSSDKKTIIRKKNRRAATKYRNKTKCEIAEFQETEKRLSEKNSILSAHVKELRNEILPLKTEILQHGICKDQVFYDYILGKFRKSSLD